VARFDALAPPERVRRSDGIVHHIGRPGQVRLQHPGVPLDLLEVPAALAERLLRVQEIRLSDLGLALDGELTRRLLDWQVLVPVV
jgi:hypothetical protein